VKHAICSICGKERGLRDGCAHYPGKEYDGTVCHFDLLGAADAYEVSFVAVPAQPGAGIIKRYGQAPEVEPKPENPEPETLDNVTKLAKARLEIEKLRFGGV
jgi:hypothetical protein